MSNSLQAQRALLQPLSQSKRHVRPCRAVTHQVRAGLVLPQNPIGIHSGVFVGDWKPQDAERAIKGAKEAGYDLIERRFFLTTEQTMLCPRFFHELQMIVDRRSRAQRYEQSSMQHIPTQCCGMAYDICARPAPYKSKTVNQVCIDMSDQKAQFLGRSATTSRSTILHSHRQKPT